MWFKVYTFFRKYPNPIAILQFCNNIARMCSTFYYTKRLSFLLYLYGCKFGKNLLIDGKVYVKLNKIGQINIGDNFVLLSRFGSNLVGISNYSALQCIREGRIEIGDNCGFTSTVLSSRTQIKIGNNVKLGGNVRVFDHDYHSQNYLDRRELKSDSYNCKSEPIYIGNDVFIGTNSIILKGVKIGDRCLIGAGSVVALKNIPSDSLVAGNPAKIINSISYVEL